MAINGDIDVTFYTEVNHGGFDLCIKARATNQVVTFSRNITNSYEIYPGSVKSIKFGCHSNRIKISSIV